MRKRSSENFDSITPHVFSCIQVKPHAPSNHPKPTTLVERTSHFGAPDVVVIFTMVVPEELSTCVESAAATCTTLVTCL